jgi:hypothetical protein
MAQLTTRERERKREREREREREEEGYFFANMSSRLFFDLQGDLNSTRSTESSEDISPPRPPKNSIFSSVAGRSHPNVAASRYNGKRRPFKHSIFLFSEDLASLRANERRGRWAIRLTLTPRLYIRYTIQYYFFWLNQF